MTPRHLFSVFDVTRQVFFESSKSLGIVNLKPLRPGHVLIISKRVVPRLADLDPSEVSDLFQSVQAVGRVIEGAFKAEALNVAVQDGASAGQSVPHVHVHIIPRLKSDFGGDTDRVYPLLERSERGLQSDLSAAAADAAGEQGAAADDMAGTTAAASVPPTTEGWNVPKEEERIPRSINEMEDEAEWLGRLLAHTRSHGGNL